MTNNKANKDWQAWIAEQGLTDLDASTVQPAQTTQPTQPAQAAQSVQTAQPTQHAQPVQPAQTTQPVQPAQTAQAPQSPAPVSPSTPGTAQPVVPATPTATAPAATQTAAAPVAQTPYQRPLAPQPAHAAPAPTANLSTNQRATKSASKAPKQGGGGFKTFALGFLGAACAFAIGTGILGATGFLTKAEPAAGVTETVTEAGTVVLGSDTNTTIEADETPAEGLAEAVADKVLPSVVGIDVYATHAGGYGGFWGGGSTETEILSGLGSGVIISKDGYILTNYHVVEGATKLMVTANGEEHEASLVGTDESSDLAVLKIEAEGLTPVEIGSSANLKPGKWVMTLGSPFGLEQSVATGIISATSRTVVIQNSSPYSSAQQVQPSIYSNMIQTDAAINPGNSGGALVDENGKLIGINSVIESYSGSYSGVGFAIPVDYAMNIATQIIEGKTPTHAQLGVACTTVDRDIAERYGLAVNAGAYISKVYSGAQDAGLEQGDIITKINGTSIESSTDLIAQIRAHNPGEVVTVTFVRGTETMELEVTLGSDEETASLTEEYEQPFQQGPDGYSDGYGGESGDGFNFDFNGDGNSDNFSYEDLEEFFNYFLRR